MSLDLLTELLGLPQVVVTDYELPDAERLLVKVAVATPAALCPTCAQLSMAVHSYGSPRTIRDLDLWGRRCYTSRGHRLRFFKELKMQGEQGIELCFMRRMSLTQARGNRGLECREFLVILRV